MARYVTREKGAADETFLARRYSNLNYDYQIRNSRGKVVDESFTLTGGFTEFTCTVHAGTVSYDAAVSGPVYAKWPDWEQTREAMAEEYRAEHPDAEFTTIGFSVPNTNGENYYIVEERPITEDYTVVFHIDTTGLGSTQELRLWALADMIWQHEPVFIGANAVMPPVESRGFELSRAGKAEAHKQQTPGIEAVTRDAEKCQ